MTEAEPGARRTRRGGRVAAIAVAAAALTAAAVLALAGCARSSPGAGPPALPAHRISRNGPDGGLLTSEPGAPAGWAPVAYRRAQLSVPGSWLVQSPQQFWCLPRSPGMIFAGSRPVAPEGVVCGLSASLAWIRPAGPIPPGIRHRRPTAVIHGIPVYRLPGGPASMQYLVPDLGVRAGARGPLARRVLDTLTRSPLSVVLRRGPAARPAAVPGSVSRRRR